MTIAEKLNLIDTMNKRNDDRCKTIKKGGANSDRK